MWDEIMSMAMNNGLWAALFCLLFLYEIKDSRKREQKYQDTVASLTESVEIIKDVKEDCAEIKQDIKKDYSEIKQDIKLIKSSTVYHRQNRTETLIDREHSKEGNSYEIKKVSG